MRGTLFGGEWVPCNKNGEVKKDGKYPCEIYAEKCKHWTRKFRVRKDNKTGHVEYYKAGHYDYFQPNVNTNKEDPIIAGPHLEPYCPSMPNTYEGTDGEKVNLMSKKDLFTPGAEGYGCSFNFQRGICFDPATTTQTINIKAWERAAMSGNCGPICPATMRPWFPVCALDRSEF